ncbi:type II secretion system protein [Haloferula helveola]
MKTYSKIRRPGGFTLIELLVVITIVAVLAAMSFAGVNIAIKRARTTEGNVAASAIHSAVNNFYSEYSRLPEVQGEVKTDSGTGVDLLRILLADEGDGSDIENSRKIPFLNTKEGTGKRGGLYYGSNGNTVQGMYDPFGQPYTIVLNTDYEDVLRFSKGGKQFELRGEQVAVFSPGADQELGTKDDIASFAD